MKTIQCDVVIVGGGIVGLMLAGLLANSDLKIIVIDKRLPNMTFSDAADLRVSAITPASKQLFSAIHGWEKIPPQRLSPFRHMHVWTSEGSYIDFNGADIGVAELGYIVENNVLHTALYQQLLLHANIEFICPAELQAINHADNHINVITDQQTITAKLLVGADGAQSLVRQLNNIELIERDYSHHSIIATVNTQLSHEQTAYQTFLASGPLAFLPLIDEHACSIVWSTSPSEAEKLMALNDEEFCTELAKTFEYRLGNIAKVSKRVVFPLKHRHVKNYIKSRVALIGDAAHTIHPLAGQGLNLGILDADCLAQVILTAQAKKRDVGLLANLRPFERARKSDNLLMFAVVDGLKHLFCSELPPINWARNIGLNLTNQFSLLKNYLIQQAMGKR